MAAPPVNLLLAPQQQRRARGWTGRKYATAFFCLLSLRYDLIENLFFPLLWRVFNQIGHLAGRRTEDLF